MKPGRLLMPHFIHSLFLICGVEDSSWMIGLIDQSLLSVPSRKLPHGLGIYQFLNPRRGPRGGGGNFMDLNNYRIDRYDRFPTNKQFRHPACNLLNSLRHQYSASCRFVIHHKAVPRFNRWLSTLWVLYICIHLNAMGWITNLERNHSIVSIDQHL